MISPEDHETGPRHAARRSLVRRWWWPAALILTAGALAAVAVRADRHACASAGNQPRSGVAVFYDYRRGQGNCSFDELPSEGRYASLSPPEYGGAAACGATLDVQGPLGTVRVTVVDQCPGCAVGKLDLSRAAFARIAPLSSGAVRITYRPVFDPEPARPVEIAVKAGSSAQSLALLVTDAGNPLAGIAVRSPGHGWTGMARRPDNYWVADPGGAGPFDVRISDAAGHTATVRGITLRAGIQATGVALYDRPESTATPAPVTSVPVPRAPANRSHPVTC